MRMLFAALLFISPAGLAEEENLPEHWKDGLAAGVNYGIAGKYANDAGLAKDPDVFCFEDFESGKVTIPYKEGNKWTDLLPVTQTSPFLGKWSGEKVWAEGDNGGACRYWIPAEAHKAPRPAYFIRVYRRFDRSWHPGDVNKKVGLKGMGICCLKAKFDGRGDVKAGGSCDGTNWYTAEDQFVGYAGKGAGNQDGYYWFGHMYSYMPFPKEAVAKPGEITVNEPPTTRFSCYANPKEFIQYEKWICYEIGLYLNTPGKRDGEARYWINGVLQARTTSMCYRTIEDALPEIATISLYRTTENFPQKMTLWLDNFVVARRYIGPVRDIPAAAAKEPKKEPAAAPKPAPPAVPAIDAGPHRAALTGKLSALTLAKPEQVSLKIMGKAQSVKIAAVDKNGLSAEFSGNKMPLRWKDIDDADLAKLARTFCAGDAEALYAAGAIATAARAESELQAVLTLLAKVDGAKAKELIELGQKK